MCLTLSPYITFRGSGEILLGEVKTTLLENWCVGIFILVYVCPMALCCRGAGATVKEFTVLLIHVLHESHPAALEGSTRYAREIDRFFNEHTQIDTSHIEHYNYKFRNLTVESRLEIAFEGRRKNVRMPNNKIYKYEHSEGRLVLFGVETRFIKRYITSNCDFDILEIERTGYLPLSGCTQRQVADMRVSYMNV